MKRLPLLLFLFAALASLTGSSSAVAQSTSARTSPAVPLILEANDDTAFTFVNTRIDIDVLANDTESNTGWAPPFIIDVVTNPRRGAASVERNSTPLDVTDDFIRYTPGNNVSGRDSLEYEIGSGGGGTQKAWVLIFVNTRPVAEADTFQVLPEDATLLDVLDNDTDADDDVLTIDDFAVPPRHGFVVIAQQTGVNERILYTPDDDFAGRDSLRYVAFDGKNGRDSAWVQIAVNTPPVAVDDSAATLPGTAVTIDVLDNDDDDDGDLITIAAIATRPSNGSARINDDDITYTPRSGFAGSDSFRYAVTDPLGGVDTAAVFITVNTPPVAVDDAVETPFETLIDIDVLDNDTDADGDALTIEAIVSTPAHGSAQLINDDTEIRYTPIPNYSGPDTFDYTISDGNGGESEGTVTVTVVGESMLQFIHNAPEIGAVDVYLNDERVLNDLDFQTASPYLIAPAGAVTLDITAGTVANNDNPLVRTALTLEDAEAYVAIAQGLVGENLAVSVNDDARTTAVNANQAEFFIVHGVPDAERLDVRLLDADNENLPAELLVNSFAFGDMTDYLALAPDFQNIDVTNFDNTVVYDAFRFDLSGLRGETFVLLTSGLLADGFLTLIGFDANGDPVTSAVVTATEETLELPAEFALKGNYPNPFNPSTTIQFDLPETAQVGVEVIDVLGRTVMALPAQPVEAGANRSLEVDASSLASGTYLYRVIARTATDTMVKTGRMTLVK